MQQRQAHRFPTATRTNHVDDKVMATLVTITPFRPGPPADFTHSGATGPMSVPTPGDTAEPMVFWFTARRRSRRFGAPFVATEADIARWWTSSQAGHQLRIDN